MTLALIGLVTASAWALDPLTVGSYTFKTGSDTEGEYYVVDGTEALDALATFVNDGKSTSEMRFKQTADITYTHTTNWDDDESTENNFTAIGIFTDEFSGTFDGGGFTISGIRIYKGGNTSADRYQGLFGCSGNATVKNVTLTDARITGYDFVGGIVGYLFYGTVSNCRVESNVAIYSVQSDTFAHGGVAGQIDVGTISDCFSAATISTNCSDVGAIVGYNQEGTLERNNYVYTTCRCVGTGSHTSADVEGVNVQRETLNVT